MDKLLWIYVCILCSVVHTFAKYETCVRDYDKMGCFQVNVVKMDMLLDYQSSHLSDGHEWNWNRLKESTHSLACGCSAKAKAGGYTYFSIRFWTECWAGKDISALNAILNDKSKQSIDCLDASHHTCTEAGEGECVGIGYSEYMYKINIPSIESIDGGYSVWSSWTPCSAQCGKGFHSHKRSCTNPEPKGTGKDCSGLGVSSEVSLCYLKDCKIDGGYSDGSSWTDCSAQCGDGTKSRYRMCTDPQPEAGGKDCSDIGESSEVALCNLKACEVAVESNGVRGSRTRPVGAKRKSNTRGPIIGRTWRRIDGNVRDISIGDGKIMGVDRANKILYRTGVDARHPFGGRWSQINPINGGALKQISVGDGKIMGVDTRDRIWVRKGVNARAPYGRKWEQISGNFKQISVGDGKILGVTRGDQIYFRTGVDARYPYGIGWKLIGGRLLEQISVGDGKMMGVNRANQIYFRTGVDASNPSGTGWKRISGHLKQISLGDGGKIVGVTRGGQVFIRNGVHVHGTRWVPIDGQLKYVEAGDGKIMGITNDGTILYRE